MANFFTRHFNFLSSEEPTRELEAIFDTFAEKAAFKKLAIYIATSYIARSRSSGAARRFTTCSTTA